MLNTKRLISFTLTAFLIASAVAAQDSGSTASTQQASLNLMVFKGIYGSDGLELRKKTLIDIAEAIKLGNTSDEVYAALEYMSMEGLKNISRGRGGLVQNDYPEIRASVAAQLGKIGTAKAVDILIQLCSAEKKEQYYVLQNTINALGDVGLNENDKTIKTILGKLSTYNPSWSDIIFEERVIRPAITTLDKIEKKNDGINNQEDFMDVQTFLASVNKGRYSKQTQEYAKKVLEEILRRVAERK